MTAINFPDSPAVDDVFEAGENSWVWTGSSWSSNPSLGPQGPQGPQGIQGEPGPAGPKGDPGEGADLTGYATEQYVDNAFNDPTITIDTGLVPETFTRQINKRSDYPLMESGQAAYDGQQMTIITFYFDAALNANLPQVGHILKVISAPSIANIELEVLLSSVITNPIGELPGTEFRVIDAKFVDASTQNMNAVADYVYNTSPQTLQLFWDTGDMIPSEAVVTPLEIATLNGVGSNIQTQLNSKAAINNPTFTGTVAGVTKAMVGLGNVDNTSDANKPISSATQTALNAKLNLAGGNISGDLNVTGLLSDSNWDPHKILVTDSGKNAVTSSVDSAQLFHLSGVTSNIQEQIDAIGTGEQGPAGRGYADVTSTSNLAIGTGSRVFTVTSTGAYEVGSRVRVANTVNTARWMEGVITSLTTDTSITVEVDLTNLTGTYNSWSFSIAGIRGLTGRSYDGLTSTTSTAISTGSTTFAMTNTGALEVGTRVRVASSNSPENWEEGIITARSLDSSITVNVDHTAGSGTFNAWTVSVAGARGATGPAAGDGTTQASAARFPEDLERAGHTASGNYWLTGKGTTPFLVYCWYDGSKFWVRTSIIPRGSLLNFNGYTTSSGTDFTLANTNLAHLRLNLFGNADGSDLHSMCRIVGGTFIGAAATTPGRGPWWTIRGVPFSTTLNGTAAVSISTNGFSSSISKGNGEIFPGIEYVLTAAHTWQTNANWVWSASSTAGDPNWQGGGWLIHTSTANSRRADEIYMRTSDNQLLQPSNNFTRLELYVRI